MALTKDQKQAQVADLTKKMSEASSVIFANYIGLSVSEISELRSKLREGEAEMKVAKKTLMSIAAKDANYPSLDDATLDGPVSLIFSYGDPLSGAQIAFKYAKEHDQVTLIGGVFEGALLTKEQAVELAKMPGKQELLAMFVGMLRSPLVSFAGMCNSPLSGFARAMSEMADKGGFADPASQATQDSVPAEEQAEATKEEEKDSEAPAEEPTPTPDPTPESSEAASDEPAAEEEKSDS